MLGIIFGLLCLIAFVKVAFGRPWGWHHRHGYGHFRRRGMYYLFQRLDTSPGQEKVIRAAVHELMDALSAARPRLRAMRTGLADALRAEAFHSEQVLGAFADQEDEVRRVQHAVSQALAKVHEALDPDQRHNLARWLETGSGAGGV